MSNTNTMITRFDSELAASQLVVYFTVVNKNFKFLGFDDKKFVNCVKELIKTPDEFKQFIEMIETTYEDFFRILVYVSPSVFTSNLIKFIQITYLNIKPVDKSKKRKK